MPELRLTLLLLGVLFLAGLAWWELRRPRQARGADLERPPLEPAAPGALHTHGDPGRRGDGAGEPELTLPHLSAREPLEPLPVIELPGACATEPVMPPMLEPAHGSSPPPANRRLDPTLELDSELELATQSDAILTLEPLPGFAAPAAVAAAQAAGADGAAAGAGPELSTAACAPAAPIVDWPDPGHSRIVAVRVVAPGERFQGRAVRQALAAQGFVLGKFEIFHKPAHDGRALLSVASLTKPGTFDTDSIDMQRFSGLNLFAVLPGPLPGPAAIDELLLCAQTLGERLRGSLQDDRGAPLTASRTAVMRESVSVPPP